MVVTGIRASQEKSLSVKRNADAHVDVISAEDIGKMPDKNVADSLARVPGVTILNSPRVAPAALTSATVWACAAPTPA